MSFQLTDGNAQQQQQQQQATQSHNESWFWEPENSSTSSKRDGGSPPEEIDVDLTTIPLDSNEQEIAEKLRRQVIEKEKLLKALTAENSELNEKLKNSFKQNQELERSIEELDEQHQLAIDRVLDVKKNIHEQLTKVTEEKEILQKENVENIEKISKEKDSVEVQLKQLTEITKSYELQIEELNETNLNLESEISQLKNAPEVVVKNDDCLKKINLLVNTNFNLNESFTDESHFMESFSKFLTKISFELSALADENKLIKDEIGKHSNERDKLKSELINYEIECSELMKNNNILMADIETLRGRKLETIMENEDEENVVVVDDTNQDDFNSIREKLNETEAERSDYYDEVQQLKREIAENVAKCKEFQEEIENLENEKSNYLFELNELKSEEERNILLKEVKIYKEREIELSSRLEAIEKENCELKNNLVACEVNKEAQSELEKLEKLKEEKLQVDKLNEEFKSELNRVKNELELIRNDNENLVLKSEELTKIYDVNLENLKKTNEIVQDLQKQLLEAPSSSEVSAKISNLEENVQTICKEREELEISFKNLTKNNEENLEKLSQSEQLAEELQKNLQIAEEKLSNLENEILKISEEKEKLLSDYQEVLKQKEESSEGVKSEDELNEIQARLTQFEESTAQLTKEKEDLIALLTTKHNENVQYHTEIMRLNQVLQQDALKVQTLEDENKQVREKLETFAQNFLQEQNNNRLLLQEKNDALEQNNTLNKDIERLRQHLLEVADAYTFEQVSLQKQVEEYKSKFIAIESEVKQSATAYTSANIRANQQAETLQTQYNLLVQQRDELLAKLSTFEDKENKNQAALTNLQVALEIFQRGEYFI